ncbi:MAG: 27 kDa antigen Cfp30B [Actinomycetota bacterium]
MATTTLDFGGRMAYTEGLIGWIDLTSTDTGRAREFYEQLFGWESEDLPTPVGIPYTQFRLDGALVAGLAPQPPDVRLAGAPSMWTSYALMSDIGAVAAKVPSAGGTMLMHPADVMDAGRLALMQDPSGAVLGLWQPGQHTGSEVFNRPGTLTWNELQSRDISAARQFYAEVLGWEWLDGPDEGYWIGTLPEKPGEDKSNCGAMAMPPGVPDDVPSFWLVYFAVEDCDATMAKALDLGASVMFPAMKMGPGTFGGLIDPTGAAFAVGAFG